VSYSKQDANRVYPIVFALQQRGYNVWIDKQLKQLAGEDWQKGALGAIANPRCKALLLFISENSMASVPVFSELFFSKSQKVKFNNQGKALKVIPVIVSETWDPTKGKGIENWLKDDLFWQWCDTPLESNEYAMMKKSRS
jgi:hypothetical protein